jgi:uncharacterized membrane protein YkvA (DUF1232 family)
VAVLWLLAVVVLFAVGRKYAARELASLIPDCVVLVKRLSRDQRVPRRSKLALAGLVLYLALPFDLIPDFIPVIGHLDDVILVAAVVGLVFRQAGPRVIEDLWPGSERNLQIVLRLRGPSLDERVVGVPKPRE